MTTTGNFPGNTDPGDGTEAPDDKYLHPIPSEGNPGGDHPYSYVPVDFAPSRLKNDATRSNVDEHISAVPDGAATSPTYYNAAALNNDENCSSDPPGPAYYNTAMSGIDEAHTYERVQENAYTSLQDDGYRESEPNAYSIIDAPKNWKQ